MPNIILKIEPKNLGLLTNITFIPYLLRCYLEQGRASIITQIASAATKNLGGQKQLINKPIAKTSASIPLPELQRLRISLPPNNDLHYHYIKKAKKCYIIFFF